MAATGFLPLLLGGHPHGYSLLLHGGGAAVYMASLGLIVILWSGRQDLSLAMKLTLFILLWSGLVTAGTMVLAMTSLVATDGQRLLIAIHRWMSIPTAFAGILFCLMWLVQNRSKPIQEGVNP